MRYFIYLVIGIVAATVVAGFFAVGSPEEVRLRVFDERRVQDLQMLQGEILNFWTVKEKLPEALTELNDSIRGFVVPKDPQTGSVYEYRVKGPLSFELCADFSRPSEEDRPFAPKMPMPMSTPYFGPYGQENWQHGTGHVCFERTIDPSFYKPRPVGVKY